MINDRFLVINVLRWSQKFHCTSTACENKFPNFLVIEFQACESTGTIFNKSLKSDRYLVMKTLGGPQNILLCFRILLKFSGDWSASRVTEVFLCFYTLSKKFCCFFKGPSLKSDSFLVIGVLQGSQKFSCASTHCEKCSAASSRSFKSDSYLVIGVLGRPQNNRSFARPTRTTSTNNKNLRPISTGRTQTQVTTQLFRHSATKDWIIN
ncbi:hypothetical protein PUN28_011828 [Cardiocondyla obscurior]|uniref:Uncharacterized protein n=1 Tax=Cardiocondyla obscurior TaxID=286306 RepID=A0AAW2FH68_9HYME